jgi:hypothetical protein
MTDVPFRFSFGGKKTDNVGRLMFVSRIVGGSSPALFG